MRSLLFALLLGIGLYSTGVAGGDEGKDHARTMSDLAAIPLFNTGGKRHDHLPSPWLPAINSVDRQHRSGPRPKSSSPVAAELPIKPGPTTIHRYNTSIPARRALEIRDADMNKLVGLLWNLGGFV
jgi:hypothetical protein